MKTKADLVKGWLRKAQSDLETVRICLAAGQGLTPYAVELRYDDEFWPSAGNDP